MAACPTTMIRDPACGALLLRYDQYRHWWDRQLKRGSRPSSPEADAVVPPPLAAAVSAFVTAPVPRVVEWLRQRVVDNPLFIEHSTHAALSGWYEASHRRARDATDRAAIYDFAIVDPDARSAPWVRSQETEWVKGREVWRLRRFDTSTRSLRGGRTSRERTRALIVRDQRLFAALVKAISEGKSQVRGILEVTLANADATDSLLKKVWREYLPMFAAVRAIGCSADEVLADLAEMIERVVTD